MSLVDVVGMLAWRTGKPVDRGVWVVSAKEGGDVFVCVTKDKGVAAYVAASHNDALDRDEPQP